MRYLFEGYALDTDRRELRRGGDPVPIEPQVFDLLAYLVRHRDRVVTKDDLLTAVWNGRVVSESALTTRMNAVRSVLGDSGEAQRLIRTLRGRGFRFVGDVRASVDASADRGEVAKPALPQPDQPSSRHPEEEVSERLTAEGDAAALAVAARSTSPERRQLTIMVCTMVASTPLSADVDPEEMSERIPVFHKVVTDVATRFGGFVAQYLSDGVHVYFGYPAAHEHDAEQAVRAGLAILEAVGALKASSGVALRAHASLATGLVVVGEQGGTGDSRQLMAIGEAPNVAAQLKAVAAPGQVVISASTQRLVRGLFDCSALDAEELKGLPQPAEAWQVRGEAAGVSRFEARRAGKLSPFVGRQEELDLLLRRWDQAKLGEGCVVLLSGEPGIGKSRIAESLLVRVEGEPHVRLRYFCSPHRTHSPLYPFIAWLERAANFEPNSSSTAKLDKLEALIKLAATNARSDVALIAELLGLPADERYSAPAASPQQKREMTLTALLNQLEGVAAKSPVLIVFEDIQWIDPTSLDLLDRIIARIASLPVLLVVMFRPEFQPTWVGQPYVTMLLLSRLGRRDSAEIIGGLTKGKALPDAILEQILAHTDGVPLFIEELTNTLLESGVLRETVIGYALDGPLPALAIPATLQASLVARLDRLGSVKDVAQIGATIGREFSHDLIGAVSALPHDDLDAALERLTASGLVSRRGAPPIATFSFKHALVQEAAYATMLKSQRRQLHASIARVLLERFPALAESQPEVVARHFTEAGHGGEAIGHWLKAGRLAYARSANREAASSFERALSLLERLPESPVTLEQRFEIHMELRTVLNLLAEGRAMLERVREAEQLAERLNDDHRRGRVCVVMTHIHTRLGDLDDALASGTRALEIAERLGEARLRIPVTTYLEQAHYLRGDHARVVALATDNLAVLSAERVPEDFGLVGPPSVVDRSYLILSLAELGRFAEAVEPEAEAIRLATLTRNAFSVGWAHLAASWVRLVRGDWAQARPFFEHATRVLRAGNVTALFPASLGMSSWGMAQLGETSEALSRSQEDEQLLERQVASGYNVGALGWDYLPLGRAALVLGRLDDAWRLADRAFMCSPRQPGFAAHALHLLGEVATHADRFNAESGEAHYRKALALAEPRGMRPLAAHCHLGLGKLYRRTGQRAQAQQHLTTATTMYREMGMTYWLEQAEAEMRQL